MFGIFRPVLDPLIEQFLFLLSEGGMGFGRRHDFIRIIGMNAVVEFTTFDLTGNDHIVLEGDFPNIQSKFRLPALLVRSVTGIAFTGEQGAYIPVEINRK